MSDYKREVEIITAVIDLAASRRQPINAYDDFDEWLTFESVCAALEDICKDLKIGKHVEQNCYQTLLRMSAESERHLTWWEKVGQIDRYLRSGPRGIKKGSIAPNPALSRLPAPSPHLIRLVEPERGMKVERRTVNMDQNSLLENEQLSMLLNGTSGMFQSSQNFGYRSDIISPSRSSNRKGNDTNRSTFTNNRLHAHDTTRRHIHFSDHTTERQYKSWQAVNDQLGDIQRESRQVKEDIAQFMLNRSGATTLGATMTSAGGDRSATHTTPAGKPGHAGNQAGDWTLSPSIIHPDASSVNLETPFAKAATAAVPPAGDPTALPPAPPQPSDPADLTGTASPKRTKSRAYSELLRQSSVMSKYLGISMAGGQSVGRSRSHSESPPRSAAQAPPSDNEARSASAFSRTRASPPVRSPPPRAPPGRKHSPLFDSPPQPAPVPRHHHHHHLHSHETSEYMRHNSPPDSPDMPPRTPGSKPGMPLFAPFTPARVVPLVLQGRHGAGGVYTPEGHINVDALDFDPATLPQEAFFSAGPDGATDPAASEQLVSTITSSTRVLILFHRWLLQRSEPRSLRFHANEDRNAALILAAHFSEVGGFVSSLFGLEQWLRSKMRLIVLTEAKAHVFRTWNLQYGVSAQSRTFWRRRRLHQGFEAFLEYGLKRRMHRKNALHALAVRRRHVNVSYMAPILRHRPARLNASFAEDGDVEGEGGPSDANQSTSTLKDLDRLNKYSRIDLTMLQDPARRSAAKQAQYHTSLSVRAVLHDVKAALLMYSRGGANADALRVKTHEYAQAQDAVALLFAFRRLYHRSIYISRQRRVRARLRRGRIAAALGLWKQSWLSRSSVEKALEPRLLRILERMEEVRLRLAVRRLHWHVSVSRREKELLHRYAQRIRSKPIYMRALHSMRCLAFVKCFLALKRHYMSHSPSVAEQRRSDAHHEDYQQRLALRHWRRWCGQRSQARRSGIRGEASRRALMGLLLHRAQLWHLVQPNRHSTATSMSADSFLALPAVQQMHMTRGLIQRCVQQLQLRRALTRLRAVGRCTRIFFSLMELRFAQALCRRGQPSERRQYIRLVNNSSCRVLPTARQTTLEAMAQTKETSFRRPDAPASQAVTARTSAEKPYRLVGLHPATLRYFTRTLFASTSIEQQPLPRGIGDRPDRAHAAITMTGEASLRRSAEFLSPFLQRPIVTTDGGALCNTPQLLRHLRKWIWLVKEKRHLRRLAEKVRRRRGVAVLREMYEQWAQAYQCERECNRSIKSRVLRKLRAAVSRGRVVSRANRRTRQGVAHRHWQRFVAAHVHQTELRRLHGGHFYNSVMSGASRQVLAFIVNHESVPFSVRHFLSTFPSYRFPIYKRYEASYWEHSTHSAAYKALLVLCQHYQVYGHEHDLHHHLEIFQHHYEEAFSPGRGEFARPSGAGQGDAYATPAAGKGRSESPARPLHLLPGAMLSDQAFSVRAAISNRYQLGAADGFTSPPKGRPSRSRAREEPRTPGKSFLSIRTHGTALDVACEPPAAVQLAGAAVFMAHWISECLGQYYALRRGFLFLRKHALRRAWRAGLLWQRFLARKQMAFAALWRNRSDHVLTKVLRLRRARVLFRKMRVCAVHTRHQRGLMRRTLHHMCVVYRYRIILRTWQAAWRSRVQSAWDKMRQFTTHRDRVVTRLKEVLHRRIQRDTIRTMCTVTTANLWRRRRHRVAGLSAFVLHYNRSVQAMDREELVRSYATTKHYTALRENMLSLLKQRLCNVVGMAYRKKLALIRGFMAIVGNVREPQRRISEAVLRDRMYHSLFVLRRNHAAYKNHPFRTYNVEEEIGVVINTFNSFRERQLQKTSSRYQQEYSRRGVHHPYVSDTLPLPSPVPPAHTLDTPLRRASMLPTPASPARIAHDALSEAPPADDALMSPESRARSLVKSPSATPGSFYSRSPVRDAYQRSGSLPFSPSTARLFGAVRDSNSGTDPSAFSTRNSVTQRSSLHTRSHASSAVGASVGEEGEDSTGRCSTLSAMAQRRRSTHQLRQQIQHEQEQDHQGLNNSPSAARSVLSRSRADDNDSDSLNSDDVELVQTPSFLLRPGGGRSSLATPRSAESPYLPGGRRASTGTSFSSGAGAWAGAQSTGGVSGLSRRASTTGSSHHLGQSSGGNSINSRSTRLSRRTSLHDMHDDMLGAPTSAPAAAEEAPTPYSEVTMPSSRSIPRGPSSILVTSPAYNPAPRSATRRDSRIFFHDSVNEGYSSGGAGGGSGGAAAGPASAGSTGSLIGSRRSSNNRLCTNSGDEPPAESFQPFSPLAQRLGEQNPRTVGSFFLDDNSTEVSTLRDGDNTMGGAVKGYQRLLRRKSSIHLQRNEETAEQMQVLALAMQRGLWHKWRRQLTFHKQMFHFCMQYLYRWRLRTGLHILRRQTAVDRFQRQQLRYIDKRRAFSRLLAHAAKEDERRQVADFAEKYYVIMAVKLALRRWRSRAKKVAVSTGRFKRAAAFSSKRLCTLFLLSLRASCVALPGAAPEVAVTASPERQARLMHRRPSSGGGSRGPSARTADAVTAAPLTARRKISWDDREDEGNPDTPINRNGSRGRRAAATLTPGAISSLLR